MYHTAGYHDNVVLDPLQFADVPEPAEDCFHDAGEDVCLEHEYFEHEDIQDEPHDLKSTADLHVPEHVLAQRLLRTRERNRAAQARYRYKIKARAPTSTSVTLGDSVIVFNDSKLVSMVQDDREHVCACRSARRSDEAWRRMHDHSCLRHDYSLKLLNRLSGSHFVSRLL